MGNVKKTQVGQCLHSTRYRARIKDTLGKNSSKFTKRGAFAQNCSLQRTNSREIVVVEADILYSFANLHTMENVKHWCRNEEGPAVHAQGAMYVQYLVVPAVEWGELNGDSISHREHVCGTKIIK